MWTPLASLSKAIFYVCLFRSGPQDMPALPIALYLTTAVYFLISILVFAQQHDVTTAIMISILELVYLFFYTWLLLSWRNFRNRFLQTMIALTGTGSVIAILLYGMFLGIDPDAKQLPTFVGMLLFAIVYWNIALLVHIYHHALELDFFGSFASALIYIASSTLIFSLI